MKKSNLLKLTFSTILIVLLFVSCKKDQHKHLITSKWIVETPKQYEFPADILNIGIPTGTVKWEILEMDFTDGEKKDKSGYLGYKSTMKINIDTSGTVTNGSIFKWGYWEYREYNRNDKKNGLEGDEDYSKFPDEWKNEKEIVGELKNNVHQELNSIKLYVFSISEDKIRVGFKHSSFFRNERIPYKSFSPIMTFIK